jgi:hypothetical protein
MTLTKLTTTPRSASKRSRTADSETIRRRALERLYQRKSIVDELIESLERYEQSRAIRLPSGISVSGMRKCS